MKTQRVLIAWLIVIGNVAWGGVPATLTYQGRLLDNLGQPINGNVSVDIGIYTNEIGGSAAYSENVGPIAVQNSIYSFHFGTNAAAMRDVLTRPSCWLEVVVDGDALSPRQKLVAVPYAVRSGEVDSIGSNTTVAAGVIADAALADGAVTSNKLAAGVVGIGHLSQDVDRRYVKVAGDAMSGAFIVSNNVTVVSNLIVSGGFTVGVTQLVVLANGNVGIGISDPTNRLAVNGTVRAREVLVTVDNWPDYVFGPEYKVMPLNEVDAYVRTHRHLPGVPSAGDMDVSGMGLGAMQGVLLKKIEELTLQMIELKKENADLRRRLDEQLGTWPKSSE